jgi:hypothetical protein
MGSTFLQKLSKLLAASPIFCSVKGSNPHSLSRQSTVPGVIQIRLQNESKNYTVSFSEPLTADKIKYLKSEAKPKCLQMEGTPLCDPTAECFFNLKDDPCERYDLAAQYPRYYEYVKSRYEEYRARVAPPLNKARDVRANPDFYGGEWVNWYDILGLTASERQNVRGNGASSSISTLFFWIP